MAKERSRPLQMCVGLLLAWLAEEHNMIRRRLTPELLCEWNNDGELPFINRKIGTEDAQWLLDNPKAFI